MAEVDNSSMKEIKVMVFNGNLAQYVKTSKDDNPLKYRFAQNKGFTVQQFSYNCEMSRDSVNSIYGQTGNLVVDFSIRVMSNEQSLFYEKLKELGSDSYSFVFNGIFDNGQLKNFDNAMMVDGFVVDVEETASNNDSQAIMNVKLLAREITYVHKDGRELIMNISNVQ